MSNLGRPKILFSDQQWLYIEQMCAIQCTCEEIASVLGVSVDTLSRRIADEYEVTFADYFKKHSSLGLMSLRRLQFDKAKSGNTTMLIWLGKQYLGQADKKEIESPLGTLTPTKTIDLSGLSDNELREFRRLSALVRRSQSDSSGIST